MILAIFLINVTFAKVRENLRYCRSPKIFTLDPKPAGKWPHLARLEFRSHGTPDSLGCGGTIISDGLVLTARVLNNFIAVIFYRKFSSTFGPEW